MGLTARLRRWHYVYSWRLRYWWLDTPRGQAAQVLVRLTCALVIAAGVTHAITIIVRSF